MQIHGDALLIRPGALGDAVLTWPVVEALRTAGAPAVWILGAPSAWGWMPRGHAHLRLLDWNDPAWMGLTNPHIPLNAEARARLAGVTCAVAYLRSGQDDARTALRGLGIEHYLAAEPPVLGERAPAHAACDCDPSAPPEAWHAARKLCAALPNGTYAAPGAEPDADVWMPSAAEAAAAFAAVGLREAPGRGWLALHPGSGGRFKCWPVDRFVELARRAVAAWGVEPLVCFGPAESETRSAFDAAARQANLAYRSAVERPLREVLALLSHARLFVGNDAGVTHLAARVCPTVALFGPTDPRVWRPLGKRVALAAVPPPAAAMDALDLETVERRCAELMAK
ncbi:MAG: hypothetical protein AMXMBFR7_06020 [Planctomycetota bacterium]